MIAHVSPLAANYAETLATVQLASRVHRMRRKKLKYGSPLSGAVAGGDEGVCRPFMRTQALNEEGAGIRSGSSDPEYTSSSEQSCDTVIYVGRHQDFTDNEGPPRVAAMVEAALSAPTPHNSPARSAVPARPPESSPVRSSSALGTAAKTEAASSPSKGGGSGAVKRDTSLSSNGLEAPNRSHQHPTGSLRKTHHHRSATLAKDSGMLNEGAATRHASDELWIDGPRFSKPRFDSRTLEQLQKEQWVDGPAVAAVYGYMDDHKKSMVEQWVHEHSRYAQSPKGNKKQRPAPCKASKVPAAVIAEGAESSPKSTPEHRKMRAHHEHHSKRKSSPERSSSAVRTHDEPRALLEGPPAQTKSKYTPSKKDQGQNSKEGKECQDEQEPVEPVQMQDCCLQVTEEDILAATSGWPGTSNENPLPEVDQGSSNGGSQGSHPLRMLSDDGLNLPSSFTDSVSVDLDRAGMVGDDAEILGHVYGGLTWKLLQGTLLQRRKERHQGCTGGRYGSLPNRKQRKDLCDDRDSSTDGSDFADVTSTKSEPADFDSDKYDIQRLNIKPMNGLKLEAFFNRIQKSNSSLTGSQDLSPPKLSPHSDGLFQSYSEKLDLLAKDFGVFTGAQDPPVVDIQPHNLFPLINSANVADATQNVHHGSDAPMESPPEASGDCASPAACSFARQQRRRSSGGAIEDVARLSQNSDQSSGHHTEKPVPKPNRVPCGSRTSGLSSQQQQQLPVHFQSDVPSSPKRAAAITCKPQRRLSSGMVPAAVASTHKMHMSPSRAAASPTSSACGTLTSCCSPPRSRMSTKNGRSSNTIVITKAPSSNCKQSDGRPKKPQHCKQVTTGSESPDPGLSAVGRSVSTPTTPCSTDSKGNAIQRAETVDSGMLPSPYATVTQARPTVRKSSSGHGSSDSSSFKCAMKTVQVVQCSGTSSGYESIILRDSTPASSQDSGSERGNKDTRGRKGSRKAAQGVGARSRSAPGRSPPQSPPVRRPQQQPMPGLGRHVHRWHQQHGHELRPRQPEDEVGCAGLLCCRLLDFY
ncbi:hypothetical protein HPB48_016569 [Haemaphysalis longicornis]|uniref:Kinesin motor domain-containing protein n=1 Tax=Haemaphysalis longicornis TaxID=44386 RepID=A0A9J6GC32_HAELO|nr:hypothetical protein HPB48_016569 [Haemaphysalis longicornis]